MLPLVSNEGDPIELTLWKQLKQKQHFNNHSSFLLQDFTYFWRGRLPRKFY